MIVLEGCSAVSKAAGAAGLDDRLYRTVQYRTVLYRITAGSLGHAEGRWPAECFHKLG